MPEEVIQVMGLTLRKPAASAASPASKRCVYLDNGFCTVCDCDKCGDQGLLVDEWKARIRAGDTTCGPRECDCVQRARNRKHLRDSGLERLVRRCTFDSYTADTPWRQAVKHKAWEYLRECRGRSFFIGGQSGSGKTHICTAIAGEIMQRGGRLRYFRWVEDGRRLKQLLGDRELYERELRQWTDAPFLYIDDLYKQEITDADIRLLYEILNGRYNNAMPTILSSERSLEQIRRARGGDGEALAGRIYEMCDSGRYCIELSGAEKNYRFHGQRMADDGGRVDAGGQVDKAAQVGKMCFSEQRNTFGQSDRENGTGEMAPAPEMTPAKDTTGGAFHG